MKLIAVTDDKMPTEQLVEVLRSIEPYIDAVILREKSKTDIEVFHLIQRLVQLKFDPSKIIVHARADIAILCGIKKVQLPGHGLPLPFVKERFTPLSFGRSVHSYEEAEFALKAGADWLLYGHLFETGSKEGLTPRGTAELLRITRLLDVPVYAIGGIKPKHLPKLQQIGIKGVAIMSSIFGSDNPTETAKQYYDACT